MRIALVVILVLAAFYVPFWVFAIGAVLYLAFVAVPYELVIVGICIDAFYAHHGWPLYTATTCILFIVAVTARPYVRLDR